MVLIIFSPLSRIMKESVRVSIAFILTFILTLILPLILLAGLIYSLLPTSSNVNETFWFVKYINLVVHYSWYLPVTVIYILTSIGIWMTSTYRSVVSMTILIVSIVLWMFLAGNVNHLVDIGVSFGIIVLSAGIFPLTYISYRETLMQLRISRIIESFTLLGLDMYRRSDVVESSDKADQTKTVVKPEQMSIDDMLDTQSQFQFLVFSGLIILFVVGMDVAFLVHIKSPLVNIMFPEGQKMLPINPTELLRPQIYLIFSTFFGAYLFAIQELIRRYNVSDLQPQVYSSIFVRMVVATGIAVVAVALLGETKNPLAFVVAFLIGTFPQRAMDWLTNKAKDIFDTRQKESTIRPLSDIIGINPWHEARLLEMGIDDAQNLAMVDMRKLLLRTVFDTDEIVHWIDQAILYVKFGAQIEILRANHITTFYEFKVVVDAGHDQELVDLARALKFRDSEELRHLTDTKNYPNFVHIEKYYADHYMQVIRLTSSKSNDVNNPPMPPQTTPIPQNGTVDR